MFYYTVKATQRMHQMTLEEILANPNADWSGASFGKKNPYTVTRTAERVTTKMMKNAFTSIAYADLMNFKNKYKALYDEPDRHKLYHHFEIPKRSGGMRPIDAPNDELKEALRRLKEILEDDFGAMYHTAAYAYVEGRSTLDAVKLHQGNESKWFLKTDLSNFFGNTTKEFVSRMLSLIFPFCNFIYFDLLMDVMDLCFLDGSLPQGTPMSPMLTNLIMIPIDYEMSKLMRERTLVYTRYADDSLISGKKEFNPNDVIAMMEEVLRKFNAPYTIKPEKTRYGSSSGSNWNLGVMLNKDNEITIGWKNKQVFKAMCNNFCADYKHEQMWSLNDLRSFGGLISYYRMIEKDSIDQIMTKHSEKWNTPPIKKAVEAEIRSILKGERMEFR